MVLEMQSPWTYSLDQIGHVLKVLFASVEYILKTSSVWLRSAQGSSVPKFDSDLFCSEMLISWDWLGEAQLLDSIITQTCFTQKDMIQILALYLDFEGAKNNYVC